MKKRQRRDREREETKDKTEKERIEREKRGTVADKKRKIKRNIIRKRGGKEAWRRAGGKRERNKKEMIKSKRRGKEKS